MKKRMLRLSIISVLVLVGIVIIPYATNNQSLNIRHFIHKVTKPKLPYWVVNEFDPDAEEIAVKPTGNYDSLKAEIVKKKKALGELYKEASETERAEILNEANKLFTESLLNHIIPHWYGTKWDYNGYTNIPKQGIIACGYFVSTPLKHMGFNLNRYKLAQTYSLQAVKVLQGSDVISLTGQGQDSLVNYLLAGHDGFYAIGLDHHIGLLLKRKDKAYFIHSNNIWPGTVCIERAEKTIQIRFSEALVLAKLSNNAIFLRKWILNEAFNVPT
ncbi:MAG: hypothetical protein JXQ87_08980 [Bacteroidia bacterium]